MKFELQDGAEGHDGNRIVIEVELEKNGYGLAIKPSGFGDHCSEDGYGYPVLIELFEGKLRVIVWDDINEEEPSHVIDLAGAKESNRKDG